MPQPSPRVAASKPKEERFAFKGRIVNVDRERKQAEISHDEIPGYMAAMTMVYPIKEEKALAALAPGMEITATLVSVGGEYWLQDIELGKPAK